MKKSKRVVSYLLALTMVLSLFMGMDFNLKSVKAGGSYTILEIVPSLDVTGQLSSKTAELAAQFGSGSTVSFITRTPNTLKADMSVLDNVDLIVINKGSGSFIGNDFEWKVAKAIFDKVAGATSDPVPYLIDFNIFTEIRDNNSTFVKAVKQPGFQKFEYPLADKLDYVPLEAAGTSGTYGENEAADGGNWGSRNVSYKLYYMLTCMNPGTFYGLYFNNKDEYYGIDNVGNLLSVGLADGGNPVLHGAPIHWPVWAYNFLQPGFLTVSSWPGSSVDSAKTKIGFKRIDEVNRTNWVYANHTKYERGIVADGIVSKFDNYKSDLATLVNEYKTNASSKNDYYQYRVLVVQPNGVDGTVNRSLVADIIAKNIADNGNKGMVGGVNFDCISMYNFNNLSIDLSENYDIIYLGHHNDGQAMGTDMYYKSYSGTSTATGGITDLWANSGNTNADSGNDLTKLKYDELKAFKAKGNKIIVSKGLLDAKGGKVDENTYMYKLLNNTEYDLVDNSNDGQIIVNQIFSSKDDFTVFFKTTPAEYISDIQADYGGQNLKRHFTYYTEGISGFSNYINNSTDHRNRNLEFNFDIIGSGSDSDYKVNLYIDMDCDYHFESNEDEHVVTNASIDHMNYTDSLNVLPDGYVGPVTWKIVVTKGSGASAVSVAKIGYSACRADSTTPRQTVNILQIYPTDCSSGYGDKQYVWSNPSVILPSEYEVFEAMISKKVDIASYDSDNTTDITSIKNYFNGILAVDTTDADHADILGINDSTSEAALRIPGTVSTERITRTDSDKRTNTLLDNTGYTYYLIKKQSDYNINVTHVSVNTFNDTYSDFRYDTDNGILTYPAETFTKNENGSIRCYTWAPFYTESNILRCYLTDTNEISKYNSGGSYNSTREAITDSHGIYGYRDKATGNATYFDYDTPSINVLLTSKDKLVEPMIENAYKQRGAYGYKESVTGSTKKKVVYFDFDDLFNTYKSSIDATNATSVINTLRAKAVDETEVLTLRDSSSRELFSVVAITNNATFDILMLGFGMNTDYMVSGACTKLTEYLNNNGTAFIGNGAVTVAQNNSMGKAIRKSIGQDRYNVTDYNANHDTWTSVDKPFTSGKEQTEYDTYLLGLTRQQDPFDQGPPNLVTVNETTFTHYPYTIPGVLKGTAGQKQAYQLNLEDPDIVVTYAKYLSGGSNGYQNWADARENYYAYKKNNITFVGFGNTFPNYGDDQLSTVMTMPETMLIVNSLITAAKFKGNNDQGEPYLDCEDFDADVVQESETLFKDSVYVDYDGINVMSDDDAPIESISIDGNYRRILYRLTTVATISVEVKDAYNNDVNDFLLYEANADGTPKMNGTEKVAANLNAVSASGYYLLYVPINDKFNLSNKNELNYTLLVKKDGVEVETHVLKLLRRAMFRVS